MQKSQGIYLLTRGGGLLIGIVLSVVLVLSYKSLHAHYYGKLLEQWHLPSDLYAKQKQLDSLHIQSSSMEHLEWLSSGKLTELEINSSALKSLDGIAEAPNLQTLTLNLRQSQIEDLNSLGRLHHLDSLALFMGGTHTVRLKERTALDQLHTLRLSLDNSKVAVHIGILLLIEGG